MTTATATETLTPAETETDDMSTASRTRQSLRTAIRAASRPGPLRQALCGLEGCPVGGWPETAQARGRVTDELCHRSERSFTTADLIEAVMHEDSAGRWRWGDGKAAAKTAAKAAAGRAG